MKNQKKTITYVKPEVIPMERIKQMSMGNCDKGSVAIFKPK